MRIRLVGNTVNSMMNPSLTKLMVDARIADLHADAARFRASLWHDTLPTTHGEEPLRGTRPPVWRRRLRNRAKARARTTSPAPQ
jgi:hypothetical protein